MEYYYCFYKPKNKQRLSLFKHNYTGTELEWITSGWYFWLSTPTSPRVVANAKFTPEILA